MLQILLLLLLHLLQLPLFPFKVTTNVPKPTIQLFPPLSSQYSLTNLDKRAAMFATAAMDKTTTDDEEGDQTGNVKEESAEKLSKDAMAIATTIGCFRNFFSTFTVCLLNICPVDVSVASLSLSLYVRVYFTTSSV